MKNRKYLLALLTCLAMNVFAKDDTCTMVIPFPPGGASDLNARALQKGNSDIVIEYKPGAFAAVAVNHITNNPSSFMLSPLQMLSASNPNKDVNIEILKVMYGIDISIVANKSLKIDDLLDKKLNVGISNLGSMQHAIALEVQSKNKQIEIIPINSDPKALTLLMNKDIDAYIGNNVIIKQWTENFPTLNTLIEIPFAKKVSVGNVVLKNSFFQGIIISKNATKDQRQKIEECVNTATASDAFKQETAKLHLRVINSNASDADKITAEYINEMKKHGL